MVSEFFGPDGEIVRSNGSAAGDEFVARYIESCAEYTKKEEEWLRDLKSRGILTATPDDGWVDRRQNSFVLPSYAHMRGPIEIGTVIALGWADRYRLVRVMNMQFGQLSQSYRYFFEEVPNE